MRRGSTRPKLALYWAASCGGCEMAFLSLDELLFALNDSFEIVFCPCLVDAKRADLEALPDGDIAIALFNGGIRTNDDKIMAHLLRQKSRMLIAFGSCAHEGCIPGLANLLTPHEHISSSFLENRTTENSRRIIPKSSTPVKEGTLRLPLWNDRLTTLAQNVPVEYFLPGCPPEPHRVAELFRMISGEAEMPSAGSVIGAGSSTVCAECPRERGGKYVTRFSRIHEKITVPSLCLIEQGIVCMGIATRDGCGCRCPGANMPCSGCYGTPEGVSDQGAAMISALASVIDIGHVEGVSSGELSGRIDAVINTLPDHVGTFWKYSLADSLLAGLLGRQR
ncbi:MAG TPA: hypothetical protein VLH56_12685 [Dissulfurispiraceae bacterium]|nr:hypothetical protein [Dissulfurispiraceae bacterium]